MMPDGAGTVRTKVTNVLEKIKVRILLIETRNLSHLRQDCFVAGGNLQDANTHVGGIHRLWEVAGVPIIIHNRVPHQKRHILTGGNGQMNLKN